MKYTAKRTFLKNENDFAYYRVGCVLYQKGILCDAEDDSQGA